MEKRKRWALMAAFIMEGVEKLLSIRVWRVSGGCSILPSPIFQIFEDFR